MVSSSAAPGLLQCPRVTVPQTSFDGRTRIKAIVDAEDKGKSFIGKVLTICGWARTVRKQGGGQFCFIALNDGSTSANLQVVVESTMADSYSELLKCSAGCSFRIVGSVVESPAAGQAVEMNVKDPVQHSCKVLGGGDPNEYPLTKKAHSREFLRSILHLRARTYLIGSVMRVRSQMAMATHRFFQDRGFHYVNTPIVTTLDCEGAGEMFQVTTIMNSKLSDIPMVQGPNDSNRLVDFGKDFFGRPAFLTVSGQLALESYACALSDVYTFGPTFRADKSHTSRHLSEFWMIEPEMAFANLDDNMDCAEAYLKFCVEWALNNCASDIAWFDKQVEQGLISRLEQVVKEPFARISYTEAISILQESVEKFETKPEWGVDMGAEHERFLTEKVFQKPVIVYNYPKSFKAFYMRRNDDGKTVAAMDVLLPKIGEVIGGAAREERLEELDKALEEKGLSATSYWWYRQLRQFGSVPHAGFGVGFDRLIMMVTGVDNVRDVIPFPRSAKSIDY